MTFTRLLNVNSCILTERRKFEGGWRYLEKMGV